MDFYVNSMYKPTSGYFLNKQVGGWGKLRFPANQAFVYGLYSKLKGELSSVNQYSLTTIEYIMGKNSGNLSYITGFGEKSPKYVHHKAAQTDYANNQRTVKKQYPKRTVRHSNNRPQQSANVKFNRNIRENNQVSNQKPQSGVNKSSDKIHFESNDLLDDYKK